MPPILGVADLKQFVLPVGWDANELTRFRLSDGTTYDQVVNDLAAALAMANGQLLTDPIYAAMLSVTTEMAVEYRDGTLNGMQERTEYQRADARRGATIGHMLPLKGYDRTLGWTHDFLRRARRAQLDADVADAIVDVKNNWQQRLLTRFFSNAENQIGTSGYDVPFVKGGGSVAFTPPPFNGMTFQSTHNHFDRKTDDAAGRAAAIDAGALHLWEHGIMSPYTALVPFAEISQFTSLSRYIKPQRGIEFVRTDSTATTGVISIDDRYLGAIETDFGLVYLIQTPRLPAKYLGMFKSYGVNDQRNPLRVRYSPDMGVGAILMRGETFRQFPLEHAIIWQEFGVGIGDRLNGYACYFAASGNYTPPTIS